MPTKRKHRERGERIRRGRETLGMSIEHLAESMSVSVGLIEQWENGSLDGYGDHAELLARRLRTDLAWIEEGKGKSPQLRKPLDLSPEKLKEWGARIEQLRRLDGTVFFEGAVP